MPDDVVQFLTTMRELIHKGRCYFSSRLIDGKSYIEILAEDFGITVKKAWEIIVCLRRNEVCSDYKQYYEKDGETYIFKRLVNNVIAYIKIKIEVENSDERVVCISFHRDHKRGD